ncbi:MFS transporter [Hathewaya limosa]|uniref:MFS family permease n=1 Tax=Hathewaya limosa TaxID=1536 RepID=A0ABU0JSH4_HATLI|nr:MFS transporter [Hathewaya limosa]MDQ0479380.1 MFS family permease [Hathewaya limosa]
MGKGNNIIDKEKDKIKLWNKDFFLLWQGQLVSMFGDAIYLMALNFWVLDVTKSTALMGLLSTLSMLPKIILGPFAGVWVDRLNRKKIIVLADLIQGIFVTFVGVAALCGFIKVWMVFIVGIIEGLCTAFFNPAVQSVRTELVHESKLVQANSVSSLAQSGMDMLGNALGGILYATIGAPYMFFFNGLSYIFSAFTEMFINVPEIKDRKEDVTFIEDLKEGFKFLWNFKTLRNAFMVASGLNLFFCAGVILILPYFKEASFLGPKKYGVAMAILSLGMVSASLLLSIKEVKRENKFKLYCISMILNGPLVVFFTLTKSFPLILLFLYSSAFFNVVFNTIFTATINVIVPSNMRGKVFGLMGTISMALQPIGTLIGGVLGEVLGITTAMRLMFIIGSIALMFMAAIKKMRYLIEFSSEEESVDELIERTNK